jgi:hypothetical protein
MFAGMMAIGVFVYISVKTIIPSNMPGFIFVDLR